MDNDCSRAFIVWQRSPDILLKMGILIWVSWLLVGCSVITGKQAPAPVYTKDSATSNTRNTQSDQTAQIKGVQAPVILQQREFSPKAKPKSSTVVMALLAQADDSYQQGNYNQSVVTIERALRIEPRNALLLYKLAALRLQQGQPELAENLAKKSELLAEGNVYLKRQNWLLIAEAREQMDNLAGAEAARKQASRF